MHLISSPVWSHVGATMLVSSPDLPQQELRVLNPLSAKIIGRFRMTHPLSHAAGSSNLTSHTKGAYIDGFEIRGRWSMDRVGGFISPQGRHSDQSQSADDVSYLRRISQFRSHIRASTHLSPKQV